MATILAAGTQGPEFILPVTPDHRLSLSELTGRRVIFAFCPADWSPGCVHQIPDYNHMLPEFRRRDAELLGISVDGAWCHQAFARDRNLHFPLLADFHPRGQVPRAYGAYWEDVGESARALFTVDEDGTITWSYPLARGHQPGADGILAALDHMPSLEQTNVRA